MTKEVEIKALLTEERYRYLKTLLPHKFTKINEDTMTTIKFKPADVRVRYSDKMKEVVFKSGDPTHYARDELSIVLKDDEDCGKMISLLESVGLQQEPSWKKHKQEFILTLDGNDYTLSLQHIENFAYILEAEIITEEAPEQHIPKLKKILEGLGCQPIDPLDFKQKISDYIKTHGR
ncbi:hypothetical protein ACFL3V_02020 [Nanoarchaeota archaeon]